MWIVVFAILILFLIGTNVTDTQKKQLDSKVYSLYGDLIQAASVQFDIPVERIVAHISVESSGNPSAQGTSGEIGLMQLMPSVLSDYNRNTSENVSPSQLYDPKTNITVGTWYLAWLKRQFNGSLDLASQAYNAGIGNVKRDMQNGLAYLGKVKSFESNFSAT